MLVVHVSSVTVSFCEADVLYTADYRMKQCSIGVREKRTVYTTLAPGFGGRE